MLKNIVEKELCAEDFTAIIKLWEEAGLSHKPSGRDSRANIEMQMNLDKTKFMGLFIAEQLVTVAIASHNGRKGWINRLAVAPEYRQQGLATRMIEVCENWLHSEGIRIYAVLIEDDNEASMELFAKNQYIRHNDIIYYTKRESKTT